MKNKMKGIILAGGAGTRLWPLTKAVSKQLLPVYDKPMIYYPLSVLMLARIREILIISTPEDLPLYKRLLGDGSQIGVKFEYEVQEKPDGIGKAFIIGEKFIGNDSVALILGDNIFYGYDFSSLLSKPIKSKKLGAHIFGYEVSDPQRFGVIEFSKDGRVKSLQEKPKKPKSNYAAVGLYLYDNDVIKVAKNIKPSHRGELEITDINKDYLKKGKLFVSTMRDGFAWLDTGTHSSMLEASQFVSTVERRQGIKVGCIEEVAYKNHWIAKKDLLALSKTYGATEYADYLIKLKNKR